MSVPRFVRVTLVACACVVCLIALVLGAGWIYFHPTIQRNNGVIYGTRGGQDLVLDVLRPARPNGLGVLVMVSGSWKSSQPGSFKAWIAAPLLRRGYTIFAVYHISQPKVTVMNIAEDTTRAVRYVRHQAPTFGIAPERIGVTGGSSGGHLSLMLATQGGPGQAHAADPVDRASSAVQAVAIFFPATDLLNLGSSTENPGDGGPPKSFVRGFGPQSTNLAVWKVIGRQMSPIYHVHSNLPPTLIFHGDADTLVPLDQSQRYVDEVRRVGGNIQLIVHEGGRHGWLTMVLDLRRFADWFDEHLNSGNARSNQTKRTFPSDRSPQPFP